MKRHELEGLLEENGWSFVRDSGPHEIWEHPLFGRMPVSFNIAGRAIKNLTKDIKRGPRRSNTEYPMPPSDISQPMASPVLSQVTGVHISDMSRSAKHREPTQGYQFYRRDCTPEEIQERGLPHQTRYLWWAEEVEEEVEEEVDETSYPVPGEATATESSVAEEMQDEAEIEVEEQEDPSRYYELLFEAACEENATLKEKIEELSAAREEARARVVEIKKQLKQKPDEVIVKADKTVAARLDKTIEFLESRVRAAKDRNDFAGALVISEFLYGLHKE